MNIITNYLSEKKDVVRANNSVNTVKEIIGKSFICNGVLVFEKDGENEKGEVVTNTVIALKDSRSGEFYTSISPTVLSSTQAIIEAYEKEEILSGIEVVVKSKKSNNDRDFYYIDLV